MSIRKTLLASATWALITITGATAASAAPMHPVMHPVAQTRAAISVQLRAPAPHRLRDTRIDNRHMVSDRVVLANLRAHHFQAISKPRMIRGHLVVQVRGRLGRVMAVEVHPRTGRLIGVIRL